MKTDMKRTLSRRGMLVHSAQVLAALSLCQGCAPFTGRQARAHRGFKIGICDWTLGKATNPESLVLAKRLGLDGVQVDCGSPQEGKLPLSHPDLQERFRKTSREQNVAISSLGMCMLNSYPLKSDSRAEGWVSDAIAACSAMGVRVILVPFFGDGDLRGDTKGTDTVAAKLKNLAPKAQKAGVVLGFESWLNAEQHMDILRRVGSPALQVYYDLGNSHKCGYDIFKEIRYLGKHICEFHAKDYDGLYGKGSIDFPKVRQAMDDIGYRGWIVMEGTEMPLGLEESCRYDLAYLRGVFPHVL